MRHTFAARVVREGTWWVAQLDTGPATQGRSLDELYTMVIDLVATYYEMEPGEFEVVLTLPVRDDWARPGRWARLLERVRRRR